MRAVKLCTFFIIIMASLCLAGCWGSKESDEVAYILAMGFDKGEKDNLVVTVSIANPRSLAGGGGGGGGGESEKNTVVYSVETYAPLAVPNLLNTTIDRRLSLLHAKAFVFSEEIAREGIGKWLLPLVRNREVRGTSQIFISRGKAREFIENNNPFLDLSPAKQYDLIYDMSGEHGLYSSIQMTQFYNYLKSDSIEATAPLVGVHLGELESAKPGAAQGGDLALGKYVAGEVPIAGRNKAQFIGTAVFHNDKMKGTLNGQETRYYLMIRGLFGNGVTSVADPLSEEPAFVGFRVQQARGPEYKVNIDENGKVSIDVDIFLEPEITGYTGVNTIVRADLKPIYEEAFSKYIEQGCNTVIKRTQEELLSDIFGFGQHLKHRFWTVQAWEEFNWHDRYPDADINVSVHSHIRRSGLIMKIIPWETE